MFPKVLLYGSSREDLVRFSMAAICDFANSTSIVCTVVEAEVSTRGKQGEFLSAINEDVNIITCAFPDTCKNNGVDKRGGCCKSGNAQSSGVCGNCSRYVQ